MSPAAASEASQRCEFEVVVEVAGHAQQPPHLVVLSLVRGIGSLGGHARVLKAAKGGS